MEEFLYFFSFTDPNIRYVVTGTILIGIGSALIGSFALLRKRALLGDAIAHSVLPGICLAFILFQSKNLLILLGGAFITGWLSTVLIDQITARSRIKTDAAIGLVLSVFFGLGILLLTTIQKSGNSSQAGLDHFLFGKAAAIVDQDIYIFLGVSFLLISFIIVFYKEFRLLSFDEEFAASIGRPIRWLELLLATLTVMAVTVGIQAVGVVLMAALLISPGAAARYWTDKLHLMLIIASLFAAISAVSGSFISYALPHMPTGPWIVVSLSVLVFLSILMAPKKGMLFKWINRKQYQRKILDENILKACYHIGEARGDFSQFLDVDEILQKRELNRKNLENGLRRITKNALLTKAERGYRLTEKGKLEGQRIARIHRLWELYLTQYLKIAPDHVHDDAEAMEHIITPEIERKLESILNYPERDPHNKAIPYEKEIEDFRMKK